MLHFSIPIKNFSNFSLLDNIPVDGFVPVIINIAPITNIPMLLGEFKEEPEATLSKF